jgi:L-ascorbate metabolism protein UlaG (beta-lactamase superfamily)
MRILLAILVIVTLYTYSAVAEEAFVKDIIETSAGDLEITFVGHGSLVMTFDKKTIHIDPFGRLTDYSKLPDADVVFITHDHGDHLDPNALEKIRTGETIVVCTEKCAERVEGGIIMKNGDKREVAGIGVEAVPAYNLVHKRDNGEFYHPKGVGNGYVMTFGDTRVYIAGDTENTPEMKALKDIDIAFLPMNLPYTMTPEMVADAVVAFKPTVLYPYHYGKTNISKLEKLLEDNEDTEVRVRKM